MKLQKNGYAKITKTGEIIKILDIQQEAHFLGGFKVKFENDIGPSWISVNCLEPIDAPINHYSCRCVLTPVPKKSKPEFKLGKYNAPYWGVVNVVATYHGVAWCFQENKYVGTYEVEQLTPIAKFDHLRGLSKDTQVTVWNDDNPNKKYKRYLMKVSESGNGICCYPYGQTSWSYDIFTPIDVWDNCEVWEEKNGN